MEIKSMLKSIKEDKLILAEFLASMLYSIGVPGMNISTYSNMSSKLLSLLNLIGTITGIFIPILWVKYGKKIYKYTVKLTVIEITEYVILLILLLCNLITPVILTVIEKTAISVVTRNLSSASIIIHAERYNTKDKRYTFDTVSNAVVPIGTVIGYLLNVVVDISVEFSFGIFVIGVIIYDLLYISVIKNK